MQAITDLIHSIPVDPLTGEKHLRSHLPNLHICTGKSGRS